MADDLARLGQRRVIRSESLDPSTAPARFHHTAPEAFPVMQRQPTVATVVSAPEPIFSTPFSGGLPLQSVVKILVVATAPNYFMPWQMLQQQEFGGTGFVLSGRRIITNAHVVQNHSIVRIKKYNSADLFPAKVTCMANICDLALLTVDDDSFWEGIPELKLADLPQLYEDIMVIGYPIGGDNICVTRGIVSRIDTLPYSTRNIDNVPELLVVQIDAAINHGNSGGPACNQHGDVVGVAFCGMVKASNIGYVIPLPVIATFLQQVAEAGVFTGICELGLAYQEMMNHSIRERFQMRASHSGVLVSEIAPLAAVKDFIQKNDVILSVDGVDIANDGTVVFGEGGLRLRFGVLITSKSRGEIVNFKLLRDGQEVSVDVKMGPVPRLLPTFHGFDAQPSYIVVGGLVFVSLNIPLINQIIARLSAGDEELGASVPLLNQVASKPKKSHDQQFVVLHRSLIADVNFGYSTNGMARLRRVNGQKIHNMKDIIVAVKKNVNKFHEFELGGERLIVLDAEQCKATEASILAEHAIPSPVSADLRAFYDSV